MSDYSLTRTTELLKRVYGRVQNLEQYLENVNYKNGGRPVLLHETDPIRFKALIRGLIVCTTTNLTRAASSAQLGSLPEVLAFVLNQMKMKKKRNVLSFGYRSRSCRADMDPFKFHGSVSQSAAFISGSEAWAKINQRLGTDLTQHLLSQCSVFFTVPPTCLVQICGMPVYDLVPVPTWSGFYLNESSIRSQRVVFNTRLCVTQQGPNRFAKIKCGVLKKINTKTTRKRRRDDYNHDGEEGLALKRRCTETREFNPDSIQSEKAESALVSTTPGQGSFSWKPSDQPPSHPSYCFISVLSMLYGGHGMKSFILNRKSQVQGEGLVRIVFHLRDESKSRRLPKRFFATVPYFTQLLVRHRECRYTYFLSKKCAMGVAKGEMTFLLACHCSPYRVYLFVRECLKFVIPDELWGSRGNLVRFLFSVKRFLRLGKFEKLSLSQVMWRMRVSDCHWLGHKKRHCPSEQRYREWIFGQFLLWVLNDFVIGLVKSLFYVTESVGNKHALRFYRRHIWIRLQDMAFREQLSKGQWVELSPTEVTLIPQNTVTSRIRFIPKTYSMRPITRTVNTGAALQSSVRDLQNVLSVCVRERPNLLGSTVWGRQDIHRVLRSITRSCTPLYFVKVDVSGAYDSLPHSKLLEVVCGVLKPVEETRFFLRHYAKVYMDSSQTIRKRFCTKAEAFHSLNMKGFVIEEQNKGKLHDAILVEKLSVEVKGSDVLHFFKQMLNSYIICYNQRVFRQVCGIPQGSAVSTMLCNLCYGHMENQVLTNITDKGGCLMRFVDDFLLITPRLNKALLFLKTLMAGVPDYGCVINPQKVAVNFPVDEDLAFPEITQFPANCMFPWCGLLINTQTLHIYNDYSGYAGQSLRYSLTLGSVRSPTVFMRNKLLMILRLKCDCILLDLQINSVEAVYANIYKILLLQAMRFHVCVRSLPLGQGVEMNTGYFLSMIWSMVTIINRNITQSNTGACVKDVLQDEVVEMMCCLAFHVVLKRHRPLYRCLLPHIQQRKKNLLCKLCGVRRARVYQAATPRIPADFRSIRV